MFLHIFKVRWWILFNVFFIFPVIALGPMADCHAEPTLSPINKSVPTNFTPLKKALNTFFQSSQFQVSSEMMLKAKTEGNNVEITSKNQTITALPNKFRSDIEVGNKKYLIVSDGEKAWVYNKVTNEYRVTSAEEFQASQDGFLIGLSSSFLLEIVRSIQEEQKMDKVSQAELVDSIIMFFTESFKDTGFVFRQTAQTIGGVNYSLYNYKSDAEKIELVLWIDPITATLKKLQVLGTDQEIAVDILENIVQHNSNPVVDANTFRFIPTKMMKQVESFPLEAF